jgi:hypothetical protein
MKKILYVLFTLILLVTTTANAATVYVPCNASAGGSKDLYGNHKSSDGAYGAKLLSEWEKNNPDKKIVSIVSHDTSQGSYRGFWVTYKDRKPKSKAK